MILSFVRALISAFKARRELVPADELNRRHKGFRCDDTGDFCQEFPAKRVVSENTNGAGKLES